MLGDGFAGTRARGESRGARVPGQSREWNPGGAARATQPLSPRAPFNSL